MTDADNLAALLRWYIDAGADEAIESGPVDRFAAPAAMAQPRQGQVARAAQTPDRAPSSQPGPRPSLRPTPRIAAAEPLSAAPGLAGAAAADARALAAAASSLAELEAAVRNFDACVLKRTATNTVFSDGDPTAALMIVGEAPGAEEDRLGRPFVGRSGQLLDRMLAAIGIDRTRCYISNTLFWRPPGNRKPTPGEVAQCLPFVLRHIELAAPKVLLLSGGTAASTLLGRSEGITRLRGKWIELALPGRPDPLPTLASFHPSYLLRTPSAKKEAWRDLLLLQSKLEELR